MCNEQLDSIVKDIYKEFNVELAICEVFKRRWSYITGTENFISGRFKIKINEKYGIIVNCENKELEKIKNYIYQSLIIHGKCCE